MAKKKTIEATPSDAPRTNDSTDNTKETAVVNMETPAPETGTGEKRRKKKAATSASGATLQDAFLGYLKALEDGGGSVGTCFSYKQELALAGDALGLETRLADLTPERVLEFFVSNRVMKTRTGREKAPPTFLKTRRVVRQALVWAQEAKLIEKAPLPEEAASH